MPTSTAPTPKLFSPVTIGKVQLQHRVVLAPLTRFKALDTNVPVISLMKEYFAQRSTVPGTLLLTDATDIAPEAGGYANAPGIWSPEQISAWKEVTSVVHANGSYIFMQLWALGRTAPPKVLAAAGHPYISSSPTPLPNRPAEDPLPRALTVDEIDHYVELFATAAKNAVEAGFDGVEVHGANGFLVDQFLQEVCNKRTDDYGGSVENRSRFGLRVVDAIVKELGESRVGVRLSPWRRLQGSEIPLADPVPQFSHFASALAKAHPNLAYLHVIEPLDKTEESNDFLRKIWSPRPFISCGGHTRETALVNAEEKGDLVAFGQLFISNPDLPFRLKHNIPLAQPEAGTYYIKHNQPGVAKSYVGYPFSEQLLAAS